MSNLQSLEELFVDKLKDVYDAEKRITKALPKMVKNASSEELSAAFQEHLEQTQGHIERLDRIFENLGVTPGRKVCHGMMGLLEEGKELMEQDGAAPVMDAAMIGAAQSVEHYEIASYGCLKTWAELLDKNEEAGLLKETLAEEEETDRKLTEIAKGINDVARETEGDEDESEDEEQMVAVRSGNGRSGGSSNSSSNSRKRSR